MGLAGSGHAFEFGDNFSQRTVENIIFYVFFVEVLAAVFFDFLSRCVLSQYLPVIRTVVIRSAILQNQEQEAISRAG